MTVANVNGRKNVVQHAPDDPKCDTGGVTPTERFSILNFGVRISELQFNIWQARPVMAPVSLSDVQRDCNSVLPVAMLARSLAIPDREIATFLLGTVTDATFMSTDCEDIHAESLSLKGYRHSTS